MASTMEGSTPQPPEAEAHPENMESTSEEVRAFYDFLLDRQPNSKEAFNNHYVIQAGVIKTYQKINEYIEKTPGTKVRVILQVAGNQITDDLLIGCDPDENLFTVIDTKEALPKV